MRRADLVTPEVIKEQHDVDENLEEQLKKNMKNLEKKIIQLNTEIDKNVQAIQNSKSEGDNLYLKKRVLQLIRRRKIFYSEFQDYQSLQMTYSSFFSDNPTNDIVTINFITEQRKSFQPITSLSFEGSDPSLFNFDNLLEEANSINKFINKPLINETNESLDQQFNFLLTDYLF